MQCSKWPVTGTYPQPDEPQPYRHALFKISIYIFTPMPSTPVYPN